MIKIFRPENTSFSFESVLSSEDLSLFDIVIVDKLEDAEVIAASIYRELEPYIIKYRQRYKYLIWCPEPVWQLPESLDYVTLHDYVQSKFASNLKVITYQTNEMHIFSKTFLTSWHFPKNFQDKNIIDNDLSNRLDRVVYMAYYRDSDYFEKSIQSYYSSLNRYRTRLAIKFYENNYIDIYGKDWPQGIAIEDSRDGSWISAKLDTLKKYKYCLCLENTLAPNYITEKIWQPISTLVLPIYSSGTNSNIYDIFPKNTFIDIASFDNEIDLISYLKMMPNDEYLDRLNSCFNVLKNQVINSEKYLEIKKIISKSIYEALIK
jgi:hypothetical protein